MIKMKFGSKKMVKMMKIMRSTTKQGLANTSLNGKKE
jgi:hypothetical protein